ncbi:MAG: phosphoglycerate mutase family protein [Anaerolineae bacterium]|nr:phosphoglycerate mutase family protein [Anaerolineae bacterium]
MDRQFILIRHSLPHIDTNSPSHTWPLTQEGRDRSVLLAEQLRPHHLTRLITSSESKAQETGHIIAQIVGLPVSIAPGLQEHDRRNVTGLDNTTFRTLVTRLLASPDELVFGLETGSQVSQRFTQAIQSSLAQYPHETLGFVTHGTALTLFIAAHNSINPVNFWQQLALPCYFRLNAATFALLT